MARKRYLVGALAVAVLLFATAAFYRFVLWQPPPPPLPPPISYPPPPPKPRANLVVRSVHGAVEKRLPNGEWVPLEPGDEIVSDTAVRTGPDGAATLAGGEDLALEVPGETAFEVREISGELARLEMERGRISAELKPGRRVLRVSAAPVLAMAPLGPGAPIPADRLGPEIIAGGIPPTGALPGQPLTGIDGRPLPGPGGADADGGAIAGVAVASAVATRFVAGTDGKGSLAVSTRAGEVRLESAGGSVAVTAGHIVRVAARERPGSPRALVKQLPLKVRWPEKRVTNEKEVAVGGKTADDASVTVNGAPVPVNGDGTFFAKVPVHQGKNELLVHAEDLVGNAADRKSPPILVDRRPPHIGADPSGMWDPKK